MNIAIDLNQMKFFIGIILLTADITYYFKEYVRAIHFYTQAVLLSSFRQLLPHAPICIISKQKVLSKLGSSVWI